MTDEEGTERDDDEEADAQRGSTAIGDGSDPSRGGDRREGDGRSDDEGDASDDEEPGGSDEPIERNDAGGRSEADEYTGTDPAKDDRSADEQDGGPGQQPPTGPDGSTEGDRSLQGPTGAGQDGGGGGDEAPSTARTERGLTHQASTSTSATAIDTEGSETTDGVGPNDVDVGVDDQESGGEAPPARGVADQPVGDSVDIPEDVRSYDRFQKMDRASYDRVNEFLRDRTYVTAREWAIARLCADFRTATGVEMTKIGENLPHLVPFMTDTYSPQAVNQARSAFEEKVRMAGATFLYGAMSGFFTADELDDLMYEVTEVAKFLLEVEGVEISVDEELDAEDRISAVMREVREASEELRYDEVACPHCGEAFQPAEE